VKFNLALCYVATGEAAKAIPLLQSLPDDPRRGPNVDNLLAQAYIGNGQSGEALKALDRASRKYPNNEKLFLYVADACMAYQDYAVGLKAMQLGLQQLPKSAALHYEKAVFLTLLDDFDAAKQEFDQAHDLAPDKAIGFVASAHKNMMSGDIEGAVRVAREGVQKKRADYLLLTFLGQALIRSGAEPGQPEFNEARGALEKAVAERPNYADSQLALGNVYATENRLRDALAHLELARELQPRSAAVYASLAKVYRRLGNTSETEEALTTLRVINQEQVARIANAPGEVKAGYGHTPH
jgi:tetratricopeptide (TPR) repeat protein